MIKVHWTKHGFLLIMIKIYKMISNKSRLNTIWVLDVDELVILVCVSSSDPRTPIYRVLIQL